MLIQIYILNVATLGVVLEEEMWASVYNQTYKFVTMIISSSERHRTEKWGEVGSSYLSAPQD